MAGAFLNRDVPYTTPEQLERAEFADRLWEKADVEFHRLFGLYALKNIGEIEDA